MYLLINQAAMNSITKFLDGWVSLTVQYHWLIIIRYLTFRLGINPQHIAFIPNAFHQFLKIPLMLRRDGYVIGHLIQNIQFFNRQRINFVEHIQNRNICSVPLNDIDKLIHGNILAQYYFSTGYFVLFQHHTTNLRIHSLCLWNHLLVSNPTIFLFDNLDIGIRLIDSNTEREQLCFDNFFVC